MAKQATVRRSYSPPVTREFLAAVRLQDGRREMYRIRNADDALDARQIVLDQVFDAVNVVVTPVH